MNVGACFWIPRKYCSYIVLQRSSVLSTVSSSSSTILRRPRLCRLIATWDQDSSSAIASVGQALSVLYFLLLVGVLVVIHELGHFVAAKLLDVKVLRFSFGYGRPLVRVKLGETEYQIAVFPIGGYVRILGIEGEAPTNRADAGRSFASRPLWQRLVIVFAGPAANLCCRSIIYFVFFAGHTCSPAAVIGDVLDGGAAARAGLEPGDRVLEIDGRAVRYWEEIENAVRSVAGQGAAPPRVAQRQGVRALPHAARETIVSQSATARSRCRAASASRTRRSCRSSA